MLKIRGSALKQPLAIARQGSWTLLMQIGTKAQALALIAAGAITGGLQDIGSVSAALGCAIIASTAADFGYSNNVNRLLAVNIAPRHFTKSIILRASIASAISVVIAVVTFEQTPRKLLLLTCASVLAAALACQTILVSASFGRSEFRWVSRTVMRWKIASSIFMMAGSLSRTEAGVLIGLAVGEVCVAAMLWGRITFIVRQMEGTSDSNSMNESRAFLWLGAVGLINAVINKSDVVMVSVFAGNADTGLYALASQAENLITTVALIPTAAIVTFSAAVRTWHRSEHEQTTWTLVAIVFGVATIASVGLVLGFLLLVQIGGLVGDSNRLAHVTIWCLIGAPFSAASATLLSALIGRGKYFGVALIWAVVGTASVVAMSSMTRWHGVIGAGQAALARDLVLLVTVILVWRVYGRRDLRLAADEMSTLEAEPEVIR